MTIDDSKIFDFDGMCFSPKVREVKKKVIRMYLEYMQFFDIISK